MKFKDFRAFPPSLIALKKKGGRFAKAAESIEALQGRIEMYSRGDSTDNPLHGLRFTKHGESRIRNCTKYDLDGFARLVTLQTNNYCILLYAGSHDDTDRWLETNAGLEIVVDERNVALLSYRSHSGGEVLVGGERGTFGHPLFRRLSEEQFETLTRDVPRAIQRELEVVFATYRDSELQQLLGRCEDRERAELISDVFALLRADRVEQASTRILQFRNEVTPIDAIEESRIPDVIDGEVLRGYDMDSPIFRTVLRRFADSAGYRDWMLFMHPDQEHVVDEDFDGPAKLVGVSGSGKTCVVVRRALRLAAKYPGEQILIVTLNRALANLIGDLVNTCAADEVRARIDVKPFFVLCQELMIQIDPAGKKKYDEVTWMHREHVDEIWQEYYRCENNNYDAEAFFPVHDSLLARGCDPERYLRAEVDWLRSAFAPEQRQLYLSTPRRGRKYNIPVGHRSAILDGVRGWEEKMSVVGVTDTLGLAQSLSQELAFLQKRYRCILVDEVQDFGNVELEIINALVHTQENNLFLTGDAAQAVTTKYQRMADVGLKIPSSRSRRLNRNYRNSADVIQAAYSVLMENLAEAQIESEDLDILHPESAAFSGNTPILLGAADLKSEICYALALAKEKVEARDTAKACIAICGFTLEEIRRYGGQLGIPVLDGTNSIEEHRVFLSDLASTKGFEFDMVCILNCSAGVLPDEALPEEEAYRDVATLYVAMTRAKMDLCISWSGSPSRVFERSAEHFVASTWEEYSGSIGGLSEVSLPEHTEEYRIEAVRRPWRDMKGAEFLYSPYAKQVSLELIARIRQLVDGKPRRKGSVSTKWRCMGDAVESCRKSPQSRNIWGSEMSRQLLELAARLP
jgi:hypothetical protein